MIIILLIRVSNIILDELEQYSCICEEYHLNTVYWQH